MAAEWTDTQKSAITVTGRSLLVSAAAGSGKTSVLAERCCHLVTNASPRCSVDQLLVVTFAEEAAAEMKHRIEKRLTERYLQAMSDGEDKKVVDHLKRQSALAGAAQIGTLHGFCARLIRQNFHLAGLDPAFRVTDDQEASLLRQEVANELFDDCFDVQENQDPGKVALRDMVDLYGGGNDLRLVDRMIQAYETLRSIPDPRGWRDRSVARLRAVATAGTLGDSELGREFLGLIRPVVEQALAAATQARNEASQLESPGKFNAATDTLFTQCAELLRYVDKGDFNALCRAFADAVDIDLRRGAKPVGDPEAIDRVKRAIDECRAQINPKSSLAQFLALPGDRLVADIAQTVPRVELFLDLVEQFGQRYQAEKRAVNAVDFSDLEHIALGLLGVWEEGKLVPTALARRFHERYAHVLVDECQDINPVQDEIIRLLSHECVRESDDKVGNLFCVGDVKQSIYRFRMADPSIFLARREAYQQSNGQGGQSIDLQHNFRSRWPLLQAINSIFARLMKRDLAEIEYDDTQAFRTILTHDLDPAGFTGAPVELHLVLTKASPDPDPSQDMEEPARSDDDDEELEAAQLEARHIADLVRKMVSPLAGSPRKILDKDTKQFRDIRFGDIAVLMKSIKQRTREYGRVFGEMGIPLRAENRSGFFSATEVQDVLSILRVLDNGQQDIPLAAVLRSPMSQLDRAEDALVQIRVAFKDVPFHQALTRYAAEKNDELAGRLNVILQRLHQWRMLAMQRPISELIATLYRDTGLPAWCAGLPNGEQRVANLEYLQQCAAKFASFQRQGLFRFVKYLQDLEEKDSLAQPPAGVDANSVRLMTVHASKGLEFPVVIVAGLGRKRDNRDRNESLLIDRKAGVALRAVDLPSNTRYPTIATHVIENVIKKTSLAEELRVLYVATTRAREHLVLVGHCTPKQVEKWGQNTPAPGAPLSPWAFTGCVNFLDWLAPIFLAGPADLLTVEPIEPPNQPAAAEPASAPVSDPTSAPTAASNDLSPEAAAIVKRLTYLYPHQSRTHQPAGLSVSALSKRSAPAPIDPDGDETPFITQVPSAIAPRATDLFKPPVFASAEPAENLSAARGTATHAVLQYLDFSKPVAELPDQLAAMVASGQLTAAQSNLVDLDGIRWLLQTDLGRQMQAQHARILREIPFLDAVDETDAAGLDRIMLRGRIDAIIPTDKGLLVIDYKTDHALPAPGSERDQAYKKQIGLYRNAITRSGWGPVAGVVLVFMTAKHLAREDTSA